MYKEVMKRGLLQDLQRKRNEGTGVAMNLPNNPCINMVFVVYIVIVSEETAPTSL